MSRKKRRSAKPHGRRSLVRATVASPLSPGTTDQVVRVVDTIDAMARRGQIDHRRWEAADKLRTAWDTVRGSDGGAIDFDRIRGAGLPGSPPIPHLLAAADVVREVKGALYPLDRDIVLLVVCWQKTVLECTALLGPDVGRTSPRRVADRLWTALGVLADLWQPRGGSSRLRAWAASGGPYSADLTEVERGRTAHADGRRVRVA
jgi:hypothetical protein